MKTHLLASLLLLGSPLLACDSTETVSATIHVTETHTVAPIADAAPKAPVARPVLSFSNSAPAFGKSSSAPVVTSAPAARPATPTTSAPARPAPPAARPDHLFM